MVSTKYLYSIISITWQECPNLWIAKSRSFYIYLIYADKCPEEKYPKDPNTDNCYKNLGNTWCSDELPLARSEWGEWICKNCKSCKPRHENNSTTPGTVIISYYKNNNNIIIISYCNNTKSNIFFLECRRDNDCSVGACDNGHCGKFWC